MDADLRVKAEKKMVALEAWMAPLFAKSPHLPDTARQSLVKIAPWLALIFGVLGLFAILSAGALTSVSGMIAVGFIGAGFAPLMLFISLIVGALACILDLLAYKPLLQRKKMGWNFLFYGVVLTTCTSILGIFLGSSVIGNLLGSLIGFWLLFEVRDLYLPAGSPAAQA